MNWYLSVLKNYATFSGRARRKEYWMFTLFNTIAFILLYIIASIFAEVGGDVGAGIGLLLLSIYSLGTLLPSLAVTVRRLHDTGRSGWWLLILLIPFVGSIVLLIFMGSDSQTGNSLDHTAGRNQYGENPKLEKIQ